MNAKVFVPHPLALKSTYRRPDLCQQSGARRYCKCTADGNATLAQILQRATQQIGNIGFFGYPESKPIVRHMQVGS